MTPNNHNSNVVIIGAGLAGLSLARHLILETDLKIILVERCSEIPSQRQKVGESLVQIGGYYFAKVLQMEEHLLHEHFMKYNLRFYFKNESLGNDCLENYSQAYIRNFSNIPCYQLDRNVFEAEMLRQNLKSSRFRIVTNAKVTDLRISKTEEPNQVQYVSDGQTHAIDCRWVIDTTGRNQFLARKFKTKSASPIKHGAAFMWVDGIVDIEKLTDSTSTQQRLNPDRRHTGHLPFWLATNHFMGEGFWLWTIPLKGKTSIGLVYDSEVIDNSEVNSERKLTQWICREFPLFADDLNMREVIDFGAFKDFAYDCSETISADRWAMSGMSGRFQDPLYSPGSDFIAFHNAIIVEAIRTDTKNRTTKSAAVAKRELKRKCWLFELTLQSIYRSLLPTYSTSYDALGDQETFVLKYTWELSVYFSFLTFPWVCNLQSDSTFIPGYLSRFSKLGLINERLQRFISDYFQWKKAEPHQYVEPLFHDFTEIETLKIAESCFYKVGCDVKQAHAELDRQFMNLEELARFIVAHVAGVVTTQKEFFHSRAFVESIDFRNLEFDTTKLKAIAESIAANDMELFEWTLDPSVMNKFHSSEQPTQSQINHSSAQTVAVP